MGKGHHGEEMGVSYIRGVADTALAALAALASP